MSNLCPKCKKKELKKDGKTPGGAQRWACTTIVGGVKNFCYSTTDPSVPVRGQDSKPRKGRLVVPVFKRVLEPVHRFIITAAQNAVPVHEGFLESLETAAKHLNAELLVIPLRYKNPTSHWAAARKGEEVWAKDVTPYLWNVRKQLNENLWVAGDIKTVPTASQPLQGFDAFTSAASMILGHTKLQMKTVPTPQSRMAKVMTTTGACTVKSYTDSKAGKIGDFHHTLGAVLVELQGKRFHLRHLNADTHGNFTDLFTRYEGKRVTKAPRPLALVMGDTHVDFIDKDVERATFGEQGIVDTLLPQNLVWHDLLDGYSCNPHHHGNPFNAIAKMHSKKDDVRAEVMRAVEFVKTRTKFDIQSHIVSSNHDDFLRRWIVTQDWRDDPVNAEFYLQTALAMVKGTKMGLAGTEYPSPFGYWVERAAMKNVHMIRDAYTLAGVEMGMHGDRGPNGAKGSIQNLRRIGVKSIIGHSHSPGIDEGCYQVGTSTRLSLEYTGGPSGWLNTHCLLHADGKRQLINIIDGEWRLA